MILELSDGRAIRLPETWTDDEAREFGRKVVRGEVSASRLAELEREADADREPLQLILEELRAIRRALLADRVIVFDPLTNDFTRSKIVAPNTGGI